MSKTVFHMEKQKAQRRETDLLLDDLKISKPHDKFFKTAFGNKETFMDFFKSRAPSSLLAKVELSEAKLENSSFLSEELKETHSDIVYSVPILGQLAG